MTSANSPTRTVNSGAPLQTRRMALIVGGGVLCFSLLLIFGYVVQTQIKRGESLREAQRSGLYAVKDGSVLRPGRVPSVENGSLPASATPR